MFTVFQFKQFVIQQDRCAMKVGTDGILLGAWCHECSCDVRPNRILDIGTGTGLVALMLAQRNPTASVDGIEIDRGACEQAKENFRASPWECRLSGIHGCISAYATESRYALIASNPPWFNDSLKSTSPNRNLARHDESLSKLDLLGAVVRLLQSDGRFCTIFPAAAVDEITDLAEELGLYCHRKCEIRPTPDKLPARCLLEFRQEAPLQLPESESLIVETAIRHEYTAAFRELTREFYLRF